MKNAMKMLVVVLTVALTANMGCAQNVQKQKWAELQGLLAKYVGVYTVPGNPYKKFTPDAPFAGNGDMHVALLGDKFKQQFHINKSDMWTDSGNGHIQAITIGGVTIAPDKNGAIVEFRQEHDILNAEIRATSVSNFKTKSFVADENVMVTELWTEGSVSIPMHLDVWVKADRPEYPTTAGVDSETGVLWVTRETKGGSKARWVTRVALAVSVDGAAVRTTTDHAGRSTASFTLKPDTRVNIYTVLGGGKDATTHLKTAKTRVTQLNDAVAATLRTRRLDWWKAFWLKSYVFLNDEELEKYYYGGLYQAACIQGKGLVPAGQYPFCITDSPGWKGDYHMNQEFLGQNIGFFSANRPELSEGAVKALIDVIPHGRLIASTHMTHVNKMFTWPHKGICLSVGMGPWGSVNDWFGQQVSDASFTGLIVIYNYLYYQDLDWLRDTGYEYVRALGDFWESHLQLEDGKYISYGSTWENRFGKNPIADLGLARMVFRNLLVMSEDLNIAKDKRAGWKHIMDNLSPYPVADIQGKTAYIHKDGGEPFKPNRVMRADLTHIFPGENINMSSPARELEIAFNSVENSLRLTGYEFSIKAVIGTRIGYPIEPLIAEIKKDLIRRKASTWAGMRRNGTTGSSHYWGTYLEFINSSLLQSQEGVIRIFPNWRKNTPARFVRLRARGAFLVSSAIDGSGLVGDVNIWSEKGKPCTVLNPWPGSKIIVFRNGKEAETVSGDRFTLATQVNEEITLTCDRK